jgi:hypothetical protein
MAIFIVTGKNGHGKTAYLSKIGRTCLKRNQRIYANYKLYPKNMFGKKWLEKNPIEEGDVTIEKDRNDCKILYWQNFSDWQYFKDGVVLCTEGIKYFNARKWESLPTGMTDKFVEHRKDKIDVYFDIQHYTFIDKQLRILCERFINCQLKIGSPRFKKSFIPRVTKVVDIDLPTLNRCENLGIDPYNAAREETEKYRIEILGEEWFWIKRKIFKWYDTAEKILPPRSEPLIHTERQCPQCGFMKTTHG